MVHESSGTVRVLATRCSHMSGPLSGGEGPMAASAAPGTAASSAFRISGASGRATVAQSGSQPAALPICRRDGDLTRTQCRRGPVEFCAVDGSIGLSAIS
ncbi:hypothetical protein [Streptomyces bacillaris]|uniref:hypothetical protein n=1 Tax=Streptomyces bacillaris TaxID=68179 RepID=UPI00369D5B95